MSKQFKNAFIILSIDFHLYFYRCDYIKFTYDNFSFFFSFLFSYKTINLLFKLI